MHFIPLKNSSRFVHLSQALPDKDLSANFLRKFRQNMSEEHHKQCVDVLEIVFKALRILVFAKE